MSEFYATASEIDKIISQSYSNPNGKKLLKLAKEDTIYEEYIFKKISDIAWFDLIKSNNYFSPEKAPGPKKAEQENSHIIPSWNVLPYLEKVSEQVKTPENEKYADELLEIINNVTKYHIENGKKLDNYRTWWYFVKILLNIPNDKVIKYLKNNKIQIIEDWLAVWIDSKFRSGLVETDIMTKLLPKFLTEEKNDILIAEDIICLATSIKWKPLEKSTTKLYRKELEPKTVFEPYWLIRSFTQSAKTIGQLCSEKVIYNLGNQLKEIFFKEHESHQVFIDEHKYRIRAKRIKDFDFEIIVEELSKEELDSLKPEDQYFGVLSLKGKVLHNFPITAKDKESFVKMLKEGISINTKVSFLNDKLELDKRLVNLYNGLYGDYSSIWFKSIASGPEVGMNEAKEVLAIILRDVLLAKCKLDKNIGKSILDRFLGYEYQFPLFRRMVLYIVNNEWGVYRDLFWKFLKDNPGAFDESDYELELYKLLETNVDKFSTSQKEELDKLISKGPRWLPDEKQEHYIARWKQKLYSAMLKDVYFAKRYEEQKLITKIEKFEPPSESAFFTPVDRSSPLNKEDILRMSNIEIARYLNEFKTKDEWKCPTERGLAEVLKASVKERPEKFVEDLKPFLSIKYLYVYNIFYGLEDAWKEKKSFNWGKLFEFAKAYITRSNFIEEGKKEQGEDWHSYHIWIINVLADLIQEGSRNDSWVFPEDYFIQADEIIDISLGILEKLPKKEEKTHRDFVTEALNTSYGRVIIAIILFSLRKARVDDRKDVKKEVRWSSDNYEKLLKDSIIEAFTLLGQYMPNFAYLNKPWVQDRIKEFDEKMSVDDVRWKSFIEGYLFGGRVYHDIYELMRNHYAKAIDVAFEEKQTKERLVQHITIGYLRGKESLEETNSLFKKIIDKWNYDYLKEIVSFFWSQGEYLLRQPKETKDTEENKKLIDRIIKFWRWTYESRNAIKNKLKDDYKNLLSDLSRLTILLDEINSENLEWLLLSAPYVGADFTSPFFIEYLDKFEGRSNVEFISKIFLEMLSAITPDYDQKHIISIVKKIYKDGDKATADKICNIYGTRGYEFLRPVYEENNK